MEAEVFDDPYRHVILRDVFPADMYKCMLASVGVIPWDKSMCQGAPHFNLRRRWRVPKWERFRSHRKRFLPGDLGVWPEVVDYLGGMRDEFWQLCTGGPAPPGVTPKFAVMHDLPGYELAPHPDAGGKVLTTQFYLTDVADPDLGTSIYRSKAGDEVRRMPYEPNVGYCFPVSETSWHGRQRGEMERYSLLQIWYADGSWEQGYRE